MVTILLLLVYIAFISLGLPDSLLGSVWPIMYQDLQVPLSYAGFLSMIISGGTIISSFFSDRAIRSLGTGKVTTLSVFLTAFALWGFGHSSSYVMLCLFAIPYGVGAGSVDAALNNYVALHFKAKHMNWLHCFWGLGAMIGPFVMSRYLLGGSTWSQGYRAISYFQLGLVFVLLCSLPVWKKFQEHSQKEQSTTVLSFRQILKKRGAKAALLSFFIYCAIETTAALWASSYFVMVGKIPKDQAVFWASLFFVGITAGRFLSGFLATIWSNRKMIRVGLFLLALGIGVLFLPVRGIFMMLAYILIGVGCAPIYPALIHETPVTFGREVSQSMVGVQMAFAYMGTTFIPPIFGLLAQYVNIALLPYVLMLGLVLLVIMTERLRVTGIAIHKEGAAKV